MNDEEATQPTAVEKPIAQGVPDRPLNQSTEEASTEDRPIATSNEEVGGDVTIPPNIEELTLKNLDTGEQFIIGENDPDFDFDTFELKKGGVEATPIVETVANKNVNTDGETPLAERKSFWRMLIGFIYGGSSAKTSAALAEQKTDDVQVTEKPKTPFTKLSNFKFRKELGRGAFGRVLLAEAKTDGKLYALKIITKKNMRSSDKRQAKAERDILHAMTLKAPHPFTSDLRFAFQSENNLYLGMDFIPGGNLRELIKRFKFLPEDWVRFYAAELVLAISHLHSLNVLYRDIKPHNVMIDARGHVKLIDFGLSKQEIIHPRGALSLVGTPDYSAPEVLKTGVQQIEAHNRERAATAAGKKSAKKQSAAGSSNRLPKIGYGKAADWWSLGIMVYEMISGTPTFRGADLRQTYQRILYADLEFFPEERFSSAAKMLLSGLIRRDPSNRLGAWENPPQDIMTSPFFNGVDWEAIFDRKFDGPYIPEPYSFAANAGSSRKSTSSSKAMKSPAGKSSAVESRKNSSEEPSSSTTANQTRDGGHTVSGEAGAEGSKAAGAGAAEDEEDTDGDPTAVGLRDSLIIRSKDGNNNVLDWSFIDANVLASTVSNDKKKTTKGSDLVSTDAGGNIGIAVATDELGNVSGQGGNGDAAGDTIGDNVHGGVDGNAVGGNATTEPADIATDKPADTTPLKTEPVVTVEEGNVNDSSAPTPSEPNHLPPRPPTATTTKPATAAATSDPTIPSPTNA